jgi:heptaprenyl diphosphate synthase
MAKISSSKIALCAMLATLSTLTFTLESLFPPIILPGAKLGLSNVFILLTALLLGGKFAFFTLLVKIVLGSFFSGNLSAIMYSLPSGVIALIVQLYIMYFIKKTSVISASVCGAVINVTVQNVIFCLVARSAEYLVYLPYLALISVLSGLAVGFIVYIINLRLFNKKQSDDKNGSLSDHALADSNIKNYKKEDI